MVERLCVPAMSEFSTSDSDAVSSQITLEHFGLFSLEKLNRLQFHNLLSVKYRE